MNKSKKMFFTIRSINTHHKLFLGYFRQKMKTNKNKLLQNNKNCREESGISKLSTNTLQGLLTITDIIHIMELTHNVCFGGVSATKSKSWIFDM